VGIPAAFHFDAALPLASADQAAQILLLPGRGAAPFQAGKGVIRIQLPIPVRRKLHQAAQARVGLAARLLRGGAVQQRAEVVRQDLERLKEARLGRAQRAARELDHADDPAGVRHGEKHLRSKGAFPRCVGDPRRLAFLPGRPGQADAGLDGRLGTAQARRGVEARGAPALEQPQDPGFLVHAPEIGAVPAFALAQAAQHRLDRLDHVGAFGHRARYAVLEQAQVLDAPLVRYVASNAEVAAEAAVLVTERLAAEREPHGAPVVGYAVDLEVLERLVALELRAVAVPIGALQVERRLVAALCAQIRRKVDAEPIAKPARKVGQPQLRVLHPEPVARKRAEPAQRIVARGRLTLRVVLHRLRCTGLALRCSCSGTRLRYPGRIHGDPFPPRSNLLEPPCRVQHFRARTTRYGSRSVWKPISGGGNCDVEWWRKMTLSNSPTENVPAATRSGVDSIQACSRERLF
jgi:hypothetical protein